MEDAKPSRLAIAAWASIVFASAVLLRLPSCYESFWLDELHTAWTIWDDFADVSPRAEIGNQTPMYFQLMWVWKQIVGDSEVALRVSSVLATSLAAALLVIGVTRTTGRLAGGVLAGAVLAIETNSIFFGTEFRAYAWVMLCSVIAMWAGVELIGQPPQRSTWLRTIFVSAVCFAALLHPTSIVAFAILAVGLVAVGAISWSRSRDRRIQFALGDLIWLMILGATAVALLNSSLSDSWARRDNWRAFGVARSTAQLWTIWPWTAIALVPVVLGAVTAWRKPPREIAITLLPLMVSIIVTTVFFVASYYNLVPLWHRRYFVAVLPMLAWSAGAIPMLGLPDRATWWSRTLVTIFVAVVLVFVARQNHGIAGKLQVGETRFAVRGEDWRGAIAYVHQHRDPPDDTQAFAGINSVWLDTDLIEASVFEQPFSEEHALSGLESEYFRFPVSGPYRLSNTQPTTPSAEALWFDGVPYVSTKKTEAFVLADYIQHLLPFRTDQDALWIVSRGRSKAIIDDWCNSLWITQFNEPEYRRFGRVWVAKIPEPTKRQLRQWINNAEKSDRGA